MSEIELDLNGEPERIDVRALRDALKHLTTAVESVSTESPSDLPITDLKIGSAKATFRVPEGVDAVLSEGMQYVRANARRPEGWSRSTLDSLVKLGGLEGRYKVEGVSLHFGPDLWRLDQDLVSAMVTALDDVSVSLGGVTGRLCSYSALSGRQTTARVELDDSRSVKVHFDRSMAAQVASLVERRVEAWGLIRRDVDTDVVIGLDLYGLTELGSDSIPQIGSPDDLVGMLANDALDGLTSEEWVRRLRSE